MDAPRVWDEQFQEQILGSARRNQRTAATDQGIGALIKAKISFTGRMANSFHDYEVVISDSYCCL